MNADQINRAQDFMLSMKSNALPDFLNFLTENLQIPKALLHEPTIQNTKPAVWWMALERGEVVAKDLCELAKNLLVMPASSGGIERVFSNFSLIQTKLRNRLGVQKAAKLVFCYRMLRAKEEIDW